MTMILSGSGTISGLIPGGLPDGSVEQSNIGQSVVGNGPAFCARCEYTTVPSNVFSKVDFNLKIFDTHTPSLIQ